MRRLKGHCRLLTWVMGALQEGSKDLHGLLDLLADAKVLVLGLARGRERAMILFGYHRTISTPAARASSGCLLGQLARLGKGHRPQREGGLGPRGKGERREKEMRAHILYSEIIRGGIYSSNLIFFKATTSNTQ